MRIPRVRHIGPLTFLLILAIYIAKYTKLFLTLPLGLAGLSFIFIGRSFAAESWERIIMYNTGIFSVLASIVFSFLNVLEVNTNNVRIGMSKDSVYDRLPVLVSGESEPLGYRYKKNMKAIKSHKIATSGERTKTVYNVTYNINEHGNRLNPGLSSRNSGAGSVLFLGDSLTFGEGLQDDQTLAYYYSKVSGIDSINAGMHGYGAHQALKMISDSSIFNDRAEGKKIATIVYMPIMIHVNRSAGYSAWDPYGPCYEISDNNKLIYKGSFSICKPRSNVLTRTLKKLLAFSSDSSEPWTRRQANLLFNSKYASTRYSANDYNRFVSIIKEMRNKAESRGIRFFLLINDSEIPPKCNRSPFSDQLAKDMMRERIRFARSYDILESKKCKLWAYHISEYDTHPTAQQNRILANYLNLKI